MRVGDRVAFVPDRGVPPQAGTVTARYGSIWADVKTDDGHTHEWVRVAESHHLSPAGHYCTPHA